MFGIYRDGTHNLDVVGILVERSDILHIILTLIELLSRVVFWTTLPLKRNYETHL